MKKNFKVTTLLLLLINLSFVASAQKNVKEGSIKFELTFLS